MENEQQRNEDGVQLNVAAPSEDSQNIIDALADSKEQPQDTLYNNNDTVNESTVAPKNRNIEYLDSSANYIAEHLIDEVEPQNSGIIVHPKIVVEQNYSNDIVENNESVIINGSEEAKAQDTLQTPNQNEVNVNDQDRILMEQRQLSSIASFGQIQHNNFNNQNTNHQKHLNSHVQNISMFSNSDKNNESLQSFKLKGTGQVDVGAIAPVKDTAQNIQESAKFNGQNNEDSKMNLDSLPFEYNVVNMTQEINPSSQMDHNADPAVQNMLQKQDRNSVPTPNNQNMISLNVPVGEQTLPNNIRAKRNQRINSQGFGEEAMAAIYAGNGLQHYQHQNDSSVSNNEKNVSVITGNTNSYFSGGNQSQGNPITDSPSKVKANFLGERIREQHKQIQQQQLMGQNMFAQVHHQNSGSVAADFGQLVTNSFDRQLQMSLDQKNRSKSSARGNQAQHPKSTGPNGGLSSNNNSNNDSASNLLNQFYNPSLEVGSPKDNNDPKADEFAQPAQRQQVNPDGGFFGPVLQTSQINYHKNAITGRGEQGVNQTLLKINQVKGIKMYKHNSYQTRGGSQGNQKPAPMRSPNNMTASSQAHSNINMILSSNSRDSKNNNNPKVISGNMPGNLHIPIASGNAQTKRSQISGNSGGTIGQQTNRGDLLSRQQKSPNMSDVQDPYLYFNMQQQQQSVGATNGPSTQGAYTLKVNQIQGLKNLDSQQMSAGGMSKNNMSGGQHQIFDGGVKSCRPTLYNKQQLIISQRNKLMQGPTAQRQQIFVPPQNAVDQIQQQLCQNTNYIKTLSKSLQVSDKNVAANYKQLAKRTQNEEEEKIRSPNGQDPALVRKIQSGAVGARAKGGSAIHDNYQNSVAQNKDPHLRAPKTAGGKGGSGSHGSNFNSSASTFPVADQLKLSEVQNPQRFMTFRFVNKKATKIGEIAQFKNLQELDLSGNLLKEEVRELSCLSFLKRLNLSNNQIEEAWTVPQSVEVLNLQYNLIKQIPEQVSKKQKNLLTLDISFNKLESLANFDQMSRLKRILAKNNNVKQLEPIKSLRNIVEVDLENNSVESHAEFLIFVKDKNDLIVLNLNQNPIMVEAVSIEKFNEELIQKAPDLITKKSSEEIEEMKQLLGFNSSAAYSQNMLNSQDNNETNRFNMHLIEELAGCLSYLKNGVLYRNKRVFNKIKQLQLKSKRSVSNYSNSSQQFVNNANGAPAAAMLKNSMMFSPMLSKKSHRYEDVEAYYDYIVEQEELKRLKQKKILAKKRKERKKLMMSHLNKSEPNDEFNSGSEENNSSDFSDDDIDFDDDDYMDDLDNSQDLAALDRDDLDEDIVDSCMIDQESSQMLYYPNFQNYQNHHDDEVISQTITSDLEADINSYKKLEEIDNYYNNDRADDHDYLNGSTAGFGKKLREINREIKQEQAQEQLEKNSTINSQLYQASSPSKKCVKQHQFQSAQKEKIEAIKIGDPDQASVGKDVDPIDYQKIKQKRFDLNLNKITIDQNDALFLQQKQKDIEKVNVDPKMQHDQKLRIGCEIITDFTHKKQVKTVQNSNESSQHSESYKNILLGHKHQSHPMGIDTVKNSNSHETQNNDADQQLNQSLSVNHIQQNTDTNHDVESIMMNKQISQKQSQVQQQPKVIQMCTLIDPNQSLNDTQQHIMLLKNERSLQESQSQDIQKAVNFLSKEGADHQSVKESVLNDSMAQSATMTQNSKKNIVPNFKLDLSKCKYDIDDFNNIDDPDILLLQNELNQANQNKKVIQIQSIINKEMNDSEVEGAINLDEIQLQEISKTKINISDEDLNLKSSREVRPPAKSIRDNKKSPPKSFASPKQSQAKQAKNLLSPEIIEKFRKSREIKQIELERMHQQQLSTSKNITGNVTVRDPTPALTKGQRVDTAKKQAGGESPQKSKTLRLKNKCQKCQETQHIHDKMQSLKAEYEETAEKLQQFQQVLLDIKKYLSLNGQIEGCAEEQQPSEKDGEDGKGEDSNDGGEVIKIVEFADTIHQLFRRMYSDLQGEKKQNAQLSKQCKQQQKKILAMQINHAHQLEQAKMMNQGSIYQQSNQSQIDTNQNSKEIRAINIKNTKRSQNQIQIPLINQLNELGSNQQLNNIPQPPKTTTSRNNKKRKSQGNMNVKGQTPDLRKKLSCSKNQMDSNITENTIGSGRFTKIGFNGNPANNNGGGQIVKQQVPKVNGKDKIILQIKQYQIQQLHQRFNHDVISDQDNTVEHDNYQLSPKGSLLDNDPKTMRNPTAAPKQYDHNYEQNTFSNYSMQPSQQQISSQHQPMIDDINLILDNTKFSLENSINTNLTNSMQNSVQASQSQLKNGKRIKIQPSTQNIQQQPSQQAIVQYKIKSQRAVQHHNPQNTLNHAHFSSSAKQQSGSNAYPKDTNTQLLQQKFIRNQSNTSRGPVVTLNANDVTQQEAGDPTSSQRVSKQKKNQLSKQKSPVNSNQISKQQAQIIIAKSNFKKLQQYQGPPEFNLNDEQLVAENDYKKLSNSLKQTNKIQNMPIDLQQVNQNNQLKRSLEQIKSSSQHNNYKTSRIPISNSRSFIEENYNMIQNNNYLDINNQLVLDKDQVQFTAEQAPPQKNAELVQFQPSYRTQRKAIVNNLQIKNTAGKVIKLETRTHRNQHLSYIQSGEPVSYTINNCITDSMLLGENSNLSLFKSNSKNQQKQKKNQSSVRGQSVNMMIQNDQNSATDSYTNTNQTTKQPVKITSNQGSSKRPQSVVETGGRKFQKIHQTSNSNVKTNRKTSQQKHVQNKSAERRNSKVKTKNQIKNQQIVLVQNNINLSDVSQNINRNIENIQNLQNVKFNKIYQQQEQQVQQPQQNSQ